MIRCSAVLVLALALGPLLAPALGPARWLDRWSLPVLTAVQGFRSVTGKGVQGRIDGQHVALGNRAPERVVISVIVVDAGVKHGLAGACLLGVPKRAHHRHGLARFHQEKLAI